MIFFAPAALASVIAPLTASVAPVANCSSRIIAMSVPGTIAQDTSGRSNWRRVIVTSKSALPSRPIVSVTSSPSGPRTRETVSSRVSPSVVLPSTAMITSPRWRPASSAGVFGSIERISDRLPLVGLVDLDADADELAADSDWSTAFASSAVMNCVWPSSPTASAMPRIAP